jgi:GT2 family glycosyltransferase
MMTTAEPAPSKAAWLDVVIVNWNSGPHLRACLEAIAASPEDVARLARVIVVDNASTDDSVRLEGFEGHLPLDIIKNQDNRGFGAACNQGAAAGSAAAVLFLNPDVRIRPGALARSLDFLSADRARPIGALGIRLTDEDGTTQRCCARFPTPWRFVGQALLLDRLMPSVVAPHFMREWDHLTTREVDQVMGAFVMMPRPLFQQLGGFDERFFVYFEDVDLCLRVRQSGRAVAHYAEPSAVHEGQGTTRKIKDVRLFYSLRSRLLYAGKHFSRLGLGLTLFATLILEAGARGGAALLRGSGADLGATFRGYHLLWAALSGLDLRGRG